MVKRIPTEKMRFHIFGVNAWVLKLLQLQADIFLPLELETGYSSAGEAERKVNSSTT
ncbi:hypothetical protein F2Q69_00031838 [Brassica cretica]|uniref:Uncharacterized protein n=1 Tax=Brassica cretica TaxID=69181 RepID=A0A8S9S5S5_BRACR|nr:hypothetical protein F2Q69_00031838 [Brassica cretica]